MKELLNLVSKFIVIPRLAHGLALVLFLLGAGLAVATFDPAEYPVWWFVAVPFVLAGAVYGVVLVMSVVFSACVLFYVTLRELIERHVS